MEQFCRSLHPDLDLSPTCLTWFRQATEHCSEMIMHSSGTDFFIWKALKNFMFPRYETGLLNQKVPISVHPTRLSLHDCQSLYRDIVEDYLRHAPSYTTEASTNVLLWQILYSLMGIMTLGSLMISTIFAYRKFNHLLAAGEKQDVIFTPQKCALARTNRSMRIAKFELQRLHVRHLVQPEELLSHDGISTLVMRVSSKLSFVEGIVSSQVNTTGRLYKLQELMGKKKPEKPPDFKAETVAKVMKFVNTYSRKLRVLLVFDEDPVYEQLLRRNRAKSPPRTLTSTQSRFGTAKPASPKRRLSPTAKNSSLMSARSLMSTRSSSPKSLTPRTQTHIPRNYKRQTTSSDLTKKRL